MPRNSRIRSSVRFTIGKLFASRQKDTTQPQESISSPDGSMSGSSNDPTSVLQQGETVLNPCSGLAQHPIELTGRSSIPMVETPAAEDAIDEILHREDATPASLCPISIQNRQSTDARTRETSSTPGMNPNTNSQYTNTNKTLIRSSITSIEPPSTTHNNQESLHGPQLQRSNSIKLGREANELRSRHLELENTQLRSYIPSLTKELAAATAKEENLACAHRAELAGLHARVEGLEKSLADCEKNRAELGRRVRELVLEMARVKLDAEQRLCAANGKAMLLCVMLERQISASKKGEEVLKRKLEVQKIAHGAKEEDLRQALTFRYQVAGALEKGLIASKETVRLLREAVKDDVVLARAKSQEVEDNLARKTKAAEERERLLTTRLADQATEHKEELAIMQTRLRNTITDTEIEVEKLKTEHQHHMTAINRSKHDSMDLFISDKHRLQSLILDLNAKVIHKDSIIAQHERQSTAMWLVLREIQQQHSSTLEETTNDLSSRLDELHHIKIENTRLMHSVQLHNQRAETEILAARQHVERADREVEGMKEALHQKFGPLKQEIEVLKVENWELKKSSTYRGKKMLSEIFGGKSAGMAGVPATN